MGKLSACSPFLGGRDLEGDRRIKIDRFGTGLHIVAGQDLD